MFEYWSNYETIIVISAVLGIVVSALPLPTTARWQRVVGILLGVAAIALALWTATLTSFVFPKYVLFGPAIFGGWLVANFLRDRFGNLEERITGTVRGIVAEQAQQARAEHAPQPGPAGAEAQPQWAPMPPAEQR